jgi:hypothetical protein
VVGVRDLASVEFGAQACADADDGEVAWFGRGRFQGKSADVDQAAGSRGLDPGSVVPLDNTIRL